MSAQPIIPRGFLLSASLCGLKKEGYDLALIVSKTPAHAAGVFTTNKVQAAPVVLCKKHVRKPIRGIVVNSKNANAVTGVQGERAALRMAQILAEELDAKPEQMLVASTGVIGQQMPMDKIEKGIRAAVPLLKPEENNAPKAIMTTDKFEKKIYRQIIIDKTEVRFFAMAKGAGMIHPNMATMLAFIITDANIEQGALNAALKDVADRTFNRISVDGDTSTNDTLLLLANGKAEQPLIKRGSKNFAKFTRTLYEICEHLAMLMVKDGEGATKVIKLTVKNAADKNAATRIAQTIATSSLVKTAFYGADANWGRILAAAGRAGVKFDPARTTLSINGFTVYRHGKLDRSEEDDLNTAMKRPDQTVILDCGYKTRIHDVYWFSDLTHEYVSVNADYRT
ncbi:MAG: bifunctional glutamate N-acetyltransferase/amino-acid acetyltransferase ArgJ [Spirochaetes bacterium]|nr:bifunctional glutamate N-acetyltransferase/amino-acid acetyltransferase ArgJ [Spirochaetota bacterium]